MAQQVSPDKRGVVSIGRYKENLVTEVLFLADDLGDGTGVYTILFQRPGESTPYPVECRNEWPNLVWIVHASDTALSGTGKAECRWDGYDGEVGKSQIYTVRISKSLQDTIDPPDEWTGYIRQVAGYADSAKSSAAEAVAAAETVASTMRDVSSARDSAVEAKNKAEAAQEKANSSADSAAKSANLAQQAAANKGFMYVSGEEDGHLYLYTSDNVEEPTLKNENGRLIAVYE